MGRVQGFHLVCVMSVASESDVELVSAGDQVFDHRCAVRCDWCDIQIFEGPRYHCRHCPEFNLCWSCYQCRATIHPVHSFEIITSPREWALGDDLQGNSVMWTPLTAESINEFTQICENTSSGVSKELVSKWISEDSQWIDAKDVAQHDPSWVCPSCLTGLESDARSLVRICTDGGHWGHIFHRECLHEWLAISNTCPLCRRSDIICTASEFTEYEVFF